MMTIFAPLILAVFRFLPLKTGVCTLPFPATKLMHAISLHAILKLESVKPILLSVTTTTPVPMIPATPE